MKRLVNLFITATLFVASGVACDDDGESESGSKGGSCVQLGGTADELCFELADKNRDLQTECGVFGGTWSQGNCTTSNFARRCEQVTEVNGQNVTYIYYFKASSQTACLGTETQI